MVGDLKGKPREHERAAGRLTREKCFLRGGGHPFEDPLPGSAAQLRRRMALPDLKTCPPPRVSRETVSQLLPYTCPGTGWCGLLN